MLEIKFRGRRVDNGEWKYGYYFVHLSSTDRCPDMHCIYDGKHIEVMEYHEVHPDTVGQYAGKDIDGNEIYKGSEVLIKWDDGETGHYIVDWSDELWGFCLDGGARLPYPEYIKVIHDKENENGKRRNR